MTRSLTWRVRFWLYEARSAWADWAWRRRSRLAEWRERAREWRESARWRAGEPVIISPSSLALGALACVGVGLGLGALVWPRAGMPAPAAAGGTPAQVYHPVDRPAVVRAVTPTPSPTPVRAPARAASPRR